MDPLKYSLPKSGEGLLVLEPEGMYPDVSVEEEIFKSAGTPIYMVRGSIGNRGEGSLDDLPDELCARVDGLFIFRHPLTKKDIDRFKNLKVVVRQGVGYDILDRVTLADRNVKVCNIPDYGTTEVADHAMALALSLRRGILLHHDLQRGEDPASWQPITTPMIHRPKGRTFGILGLGRIGICTALRAKAFGFRVIFYDPYVANGLDKSLNVERIRSIDEFFSMTETLSIHTPLTKTTKGIVSERLLRLMPSGAIIVNTARGPVIDLDGLESVLRDGALAGAALDVLPEEPIPEPAHSLIQAYRKKEPWLLGRLVVTPHSAFHSAEAWMDIRTFGAETMRNTLLGIDHNVIPPDAE